MKKLYLLIAVCLTTFLAQAAELTPQQLKLRLDIKKALEAKGLGTSIDTDGDLNFIRDGLNYWISIRPTWSDPFLVATCIGFTYEDDYTKENVEAAMSAINQNKVVKILKFDDAYRYQTDVLCRDASQYMSSFDAIMQSIDNSRNQFRDLLKAGLGGVDVTGDKSTVFTKAFMLYLLDDNQKAFNIFSYLADENYPRAYAMLAVLYGNGEGVAKNEKKMVEYYEKAIDSGLDWCAYNLGKYYLDKKDYPKAIEYFTRCCSTDNSNRSDAYYMLGEMNENGTGMAPDMKKAIQNYRKSVEYSTELACDARLALIRLGEPVENIADFEEINSALLEGLTPAAMYEKGLEYEQGLNDRNISLPKAYGYFKAAADHNNPKAIIKMGEIYVSKYYPFHDKSKSDKYYAKALKTLKTQESVSADACYQLGMMYKNGLGVQKDPASAMSYFRKAAAKENAAANYELGLVYKEELEYVEAFNFFLKAAEGDNGDAMLEVAKAYETGIGTSKDREKALEWYRKCSNSDSLASKEASKHLKSMKSEESGDDEKG